MPTGWTAAARWILRRALPADEADAVLGDLVEDARPRARIVFDAISIAAHRALGRRAGGRPQTGLRAAISDVRYGIRALANRPGFSVAVAMTLTVAIGASAAMFAVVNAVLRPLPFADADRLAWIGSLRPDNVDAPFTLPEFMDYRAQTQSLSGLAAYTNWSASLAGEGVTERLQGARMSANAFDVLGLTATAGRLLQDSDDSATAGRVVVISHRLWRQRFGGAADVVGRVARINAEPYVIVGVVPPGFTLPLRDIDVITALVPDRDPLRHARASVNFLRLFGRVKPGVTIDQAEQELTTICRELRRQFPAEYARKEGVRARRLAEAVVGDHRQGLVLLLTSVLVVMAAALANLLGLVLVRSHDRRPEISIRVALGASRLRIARQLTAEALVLSAAGAIGGSAIAAAAIATVPAWAPAAIPRLADARFDGHALLVVAALATGAATLMALAASMTLLRARTSLSWRPVARAAGGDRWQRRLRDVLVVGEIASAVALLLGTTVLGHDFARLQRVDPGFEPDSVFQARVSLPASYRSPADIAQFFDRLTERVTALAGVRRVGVISVAPLSGLLVTVPFSVEGQPADRRDMPNVNLRAISPGYLDAAGTRLAQGRAFTDADRAGAPAVALVSAALAERMLADGPLGRRLLIDDNNTGPRPVEIVGVVENVRQMTVSGPATMDVYIALSQIHPDGVPVVRNNHFWMIRSDSEPASLSQPFASALRGVDRDAAISSVGTMRRYVDEWFAPLRFSLGLFMSFALSAVLLSVTGLYGLIAYTVSQRRREIGLRMALGATSGGVRRLFLRHAAILAMAGIAVGLIVAVLARPLAARLTMDPMVDTSAIFGIAALIFVVTIAAAWLPARRAARIAPTVALKLD